MARFVVRIELHAPSDENYEALRTIMVANGYSPEIIADDGKRFQLPSNEYVAMAAANAEQVRDHINRILGAILHTGWVMVSSADNWAGSLQRVS